MHLWLLLLLSSSSIQEKPSILEGRSFLHRMKEKWHSHCIQEVPYGTGCSERRENIPFFRGASYTQKIIKTVEIGYSNSFFLKSKWLRRKSLKLTSYFRLFHPQTNVSYKDCWKSFRPAQLPGRDTGWLSCLGKIHSNLLQCPRVMPKAPAFRLWWAVTYAGKDFGSIVIWNISAPLSIPLPIFLQATL